MAKIGSPWHQMLPSNRGGRRKTYATPQELAEACAGYFQWVEDNPIYETRAYAYQGEVVQEEVPKPRVYTVIGMCLYLGISQRTWNHYKNSEDEDFLEVVDAVDDAIYNQKFEGASSDMFNASFIGKAIGLQERHEHDHRSGDGSMSPRPLSSFYGDDDSDVESGNED